MTGSPAEQAIRTEINDYLAAYEANDATACAALFTDTATLVSPLDPPLFGRAAIADAHQAWFKEGDRNKVMTVMDLDTSGDLGTCLVAFSADVPSESGDTEAFHGTSLNTLKHLPDGTWRISQCFLHALEAPLQ